MAEPTRYVTATVCSVCEKLLPTGVREGYVGDVFVPRDVMPPGTFKRAKDRIPKGVDWTLSLTRIITYQYTCLGCRPATHGEHVVLVISMCDHCNKQTPLRLAKKRRDSEWTVRKCPIPEEMLTQYPPLASQSLVMVEWVRCDGCVKGYQDSIDLLVKGYVEKAMAPETQSYDTEGATQYFRSSRRGPRSSSSSSAR